MRTQDAADKIEMTLGEAGVVLLGDRGLWWPIAGTLVLADLHLGKTDAMRASGAPMPSGITRDTLQRVDQLLERTAARRLLVVGDLLHAPAGLTDNLIDRVAAWRAGHPSLGVALVPGNHDRALKRVVDRWAIDVLPEHHTERFGEESLAFCHEPCHTPGTHTIAGHLHPAVSLRGGGDQIKLPCFVVGERCTVLPAFSRFTAGAVVRPAGDERLFGVAEGMLIPCDRVPARAGSGRSALLRR